MVFDKENYICLENGKPYSIFRTSSSLLKIRCILQDRYSR